MTTAIVYTINDNDEIISSFECEYNQAIASYWSKRTDNGRYYIGVKGISIPYKWKRTTPKKFIQSPSGDGTIQDR